VSFPGHFLVKLRMQSGAQQGDVVIDPFSGQSLSREDLNERLAPYRQRQSLMNEEDMPLGLFLQAATPREVLARMLRNLKEIYRSSGDWPRLLPVQERLVVLLPQDWVERRDRGYAKAELGFYEAAVEDLSESLLRAPGARDHAAVAVRVEEMRAQPRPRLH
jgi:regulator of sirC expression with transglutaminase-like and TPR domain